MIVSTVVVLGVLIFVHELGHFLVAKWAGVRVEKFSLGFGPKLVGITRGDTEYLLSLIPLGGYVKMLGEDLEAEVSEDQLHRSFSAQPVLKRMAIVFAGPLANFLLAILIFTCMYTFAGRPELTTDVGTVSPGSPAEMAGVQAGDKVMTIDGVPVGTWEELSATIEKHGDDPLTLGLRRGETTITVSVKPSISEVKNLFGETVKRPLIGVTASGKVEVQYVNPLLAGYYSIEQTLRLSKLFVLTVVKLIERVVPFQTLGGPILIAQMAGQQAEEGLLNLINFIALISVNLAVLNLLPIPVLDGGHLLFFSLEAVLGRSIGTKRIEMAQKVGMLVLLVLMIFVFYNDIMRVIPGHKPDLLP